MATSYSLSDLAVISGVGVSTIRSYKYKGLIPGSRGAGRGANYGEEHVEALRKIGEYRGLGYSMEAIKAIVEGRVDTLPTDRELKAEGIEHGVDLQASDRVEGRHGRFANPNENLTSVAKVWGRVKLFEGLELHFEIGRYEVFPRNVKELRDALEAILGAGEE